MNQRSLITRLRKADPVAGREAADDPGLRRARIDAILASTAPLRWRRVPPTPHDGAAHHARGTAGP
jgi:hypothetical protein